jgi:light-regulated signal transduction histidine kinase (bacteriophytochrome)
MESITAVTVDLTDDREPIHIPGSVQPHGILFVLSEPDLIIEQGNRSGGLKRRIEKKGRCC